MIKVVLVSALVVFGPLVGLACLCWRTLARELEELAREDEEEGEE